MCAGLVLKRVPRAMGQSWECGSASAGAASDRRARHASDDPIQIGAVQIWGLELRSANAGCRRAYLNEAISDVTRPFAACGTRTCPCTPATPTPQAGRWAGRGAGAAL